MTADYENEDYFETIACALFADHKLWVQIFLRHKIDNRIEEKEDDIYDFLSLKDINAGNLKIITEHLTKFNKKKNRWF